MKIKWHRVKILEKRIVSRVFGWQLAGVAMAFALVAYPTHAFNYDHVADLQEAEQVVVRTTGQYQFPLERTMGVSQGFHLLHPGVDYRAPKGTNVYSVEAGVVIEVKAMAVGYGHFVRVAHGGTMSSLYAHLDKVEVVAGQKIARGTELGTVGTTGWSTGPHLHFEMYAGNKAINPASYVRLGKDLI